MTEPGRISRRPPSDGAGLTDPAPTNYEVVIGLEVHAQLSTKSKMFCGCTTKFGAPPNAQTCPVCQGMPGVLPVINRRAVEFGIRTALAFNCRVNPSCRFARKHYYYPDMPKNYQISQYEEPLAEDGFLEIEAEGGSRNIGIQRLHLEEDVGKLLHEGTLETAQSSLVDFNRSGVPLMETVSRPELHSPEEAATYLKAFRAVLIFLEVCDGNMEEGSLRCDANISLRPRGQTELGTKVEIKNLNSFRNVQRALEFEVRRQAQALDAGERIVQETRLWEADRGYTRSMRSKEFAHDYRYFPEPDLVPLRLDRAWVDEIRAALPELPRARRQRFVSQYGVPAYDAEVLTQSRALADYYEAAVQALGSAAAGNRADRPKTVSNWIMSELLAALPGDDELAIQHSPITPRHLAGLLRLIEDGTISGKIAKDVFQKMLASGDDAAAIVAREGLTQVADEAALSQIIVTVMAANPRAIDDYKRGKKEAKGALVGQVMKATGGKANPALVNRLLEDKLSKT
ncbi:MAG TPA: Asp-tRNA(Asn)/Glu-tRNA(Gln) amidotransferase subunit GatB [Methylomirabilota bacterium]|nr:Asp-tRNA(Asn)/Glu-tRNA(Gln) amidotransferase subunit GatB [Methylomirabilota bacterium]